MGHGNSVPRFHVSWGTGPGVVAPFERRARDSAASGRLTFRFRHRVDAMSITNGTVDGITGSILEPTSVERGKSSSRHVVGDFSLRAQAVIIASGGIGGNHDLVRRNWPQRLGLAPKNMISGVPEHVDGRMIGITKAAGARLINRDRMWHYVEGIRNWSQIWPRHGIGILTRSDKVLIKPRGFAGSSHFLNTVLKVSWSNRATVGSNQLDSLN